MVHTVVSQCPQGDITGGMQELVNIGEQICVVNIRGINAS